MIFLFPKCPKNFAGFQISTFAFITELSLIENSMSLT